MRLLPATILAFVFARPLGSFVQRFVTTKKPTDRQLANAIKAGESLLHASATARSSVANPFRRIWSMGILQVMAGATLMALVLSAVKAATGLAWIPDLTR